MSDVNETREEQLVPGMLFHPTPMVVIADVVTAQNGKSIVLLRFETPNGMFLFGVQSPDEADKIAADISKQAERLRTESNGLQVIQGPEAQAVARAATNPPKQ